MQTHFRIMHILIAKIAAFIPCIQENICSQKPWREPRTVLLPTTYSIVSVSFKLRPTSHVNRIKLAMAVLWGSKNLWSLTRWRGFCCCVSVTTILSVSGDWFHYLSHKQVSLVFSTPFCGATSSACFILCLLSVGFFNTDKILRGTYS